MVAPLAGPDLASWWEDEPVVEPHPAEVLPREQLAGRIQHALVGQAITERQVHQHVQDTLEFGFDAAFVPPAWVKIAKREIGDAGRVGSFLDYPHGSSSPPRDGRRPSSGCPMGPVRSCSHASGSGPRHRPEIRPGG